ncbi:MAG: hypothetical protein QNK05_25470 [Myxococcota bacterium]|nr:hypothetical protein [Myxococcota bacterium]
MRLPFLLILALLAGAPAGGATIDFAGSVLDGSTVSDLLGGPGALSLEIDLSSPGRIALAVDLEAQGPVALQALVFNFLPFDLAEVSLSLSGGASFALLGDASRGTGEPLPVTGAGSGASVRFDPPEAALFSIGDPLATGAVDWLIDVSAVTSGGFGLEISVPEPGRFGPLLLTVLFAAARRRAMGADELGKSSGARLDSPG